MTMSTNCEIAQARGRVGMVLPLPILGCFENPLVHEKRYVKIIKKEEGALKAISVGEPVVLDSLAKLLLHRYRQ